MHINRLTRIAAVALVAGFMVFALAGCGPKVPNVVGMPADQAVRELQSAGYLLGATTKMYTSAVPPGQVFEQNPRAGDNLREGQPVAITVAAALGSISVPDVSKMSADEASSAIAGIGLLPMQVDEYSTDVAKGSIGGQIPEAGAKVDVGATVVYVVSKGTAPTKVKVPDITGKKQEDADAAIKKAGLKPAAQKAYSDTVSKDVIALQNPAAGASVSPGSTVSYVVSLGKPTKAVTVPKVTGKSESDAVAALKSAGLSSETYREADPNVAEGVVISQMPPSGSETVAGGIVGILVSLGSESTVDVPDVTGKSADNAKSAIEAAGLIAVPVEQPSADVGKGDVIQQLPVAGSVVPAGSQVLYAVSTGTPE
jgi:eukaryotic-like serine/threonine-protein kinase